MNDKLKRLAERRKRLIDLAEMQRVAISQEVEPWRHALTNVDKGLAALRYLKNHPIWLASGASLLILAIGPGRVLKWLGQGLIAWRTLSQFRNR